MKKALISSCFLAVVGFFCASQVLAHARWSQDGTTPGRNNKANLKVGPCGNVARGSNPAVFKAGQTITLNWESTIYHEGYFRIAFSPADDKGFDQAVLLDNIPERERPPGPYSAQVTLPSEPCEACTLQLIQVMLDRTPPTNYYSCADIQLIVDDDTADTTAPAPVSALAWVEGSHRIQWQNPRHDFAGVLLLSHPDSMSQSANSDQPQTGIFYRVGDRLGNASVVYTGQGQSFEPANEDRYFSVYTFDRAGNYSAAQRLMATIYEPELYFDMSVQYEQVGQPEAGVFAADGPVIVQATTTTMAGAGDIALTVSDTQSAVIFAEQGAGMWTFDPSDFAGDALALSITGRDSLHPDKPLVHPLVVEVAPYSYYKPRLAFYQGGQLLTRAATTDGGDITVKVEFDGPVPSNLSVWRAQWLEIPMPSTTVSDNGMSVSFPAGLKTVNVTFEVEVFSDSAPAAPTLSESLSIHKPLLIGSTSLGWLMMYVGLGLILRVRLQALY
ncbi:SCE4755 family polysaccharide monooxygenase-like protein [Marinagarivorans algicola]|uniref:SCE4755 family polysaccharide monooxygenase-like protein n=1 Tax=Marinagarivorans algicola TaxID=1513270 RepID=UPI003734F5D2